MFDGGDGYRLTSEAWATAWRPRRPPTPSVWAGMRRRLSSKHAAEAGQWDNARTPYLVGVMDALDNRKCIAPIVVFMKSSQVGATNAGLNWIGWTIDESPTSMLAYFPGEKLGREWVRVQLEPMLEETPSLREKMPAGRRADKGDTVQAKHFPNGQLIVKSSNIATDMASSNAERILLDEVDRFPYEIENEGDPVELILRRTTTYQGRSKVFLNSSPTIASLSHILKWWKASSQGHFFVPCPHCAAMQVLVWENLLWPEGRPQDAQYRCGHCEAMIAEHHKTDMLAAGEWRHDHDDRTESIIGFHINCLYTPIGLGDSWGANAEAYERAKRDPPKLKAFTNTRLGETHEDPTEKLDWETLKDRREPFSLGTVPKGALILTAGVDVQKDRLEVQTIGWGRGECAWTADYVVKPGDPTRDELWQWLDDYLARTFTNEFGIEMRISSCAIDAGYLQHDVLNFVRDKRSRNVFATKGQPQFGRQVLSHPVKVDFRHSGKVWKRGAELHLLGQSTVKRTLFERMRADAGEPDFQMPAEMRHVHFSRDLPDEYFRQLTAQVFDPHKRLWVNTYERDEALDTFVLAMAAAMHHSTHVHRFSESDWARLEMLYQPTEKPKAPQPQVLGERPVVTAKGVFVPMRAVVKPSED